MIVGMRTLQNLLALYTWQLRGSGGGEGGCERRCSKAVSVVVYSQEATKDTIPVSL